MTAAPYSDLYWECFTLRNLDLPVSYYQEHYPRFYELCLSAARHRDAFFLRNPVTWHHRWLAWRDRRMASHALAEELIARFPEGARLAGVS